VISLLAALCLIASGLVVLGTFTPAQPAQAAASCPPAITELENPSFEAPILSTNTYQQLNDSKVPGWSTTATDRLIEIWKSGFNGVPAASGLQFAEINATQNAALYQDLPTTPGQTLTWGLSHRGRQGVDTMHVEIGPPGGPSNYSSGTISDGTSAWGRWSGSYTVPAGQFTTRFAFIADSTAGGNKSVGNFLDDISFGTPACVTATKSVYPAGAVDVGETLTYVVAVTNEGGAATRNITITDAIPANTTYVAGSASPSGTLSGSTLTLRPAGTGGVPGVLEPGATAVVSFQVTVNSSAAQTTIRNTASVSSDNGLAVDNFTTNEVATPVNAAADVKLVKGFPTGTLASGGIVTMYFVLTNLGPSTASNITLSDVIPAGLTLPANLPAGCSSAISGGNTVLTCVQSSLALNQTVTISMDMTAATTVTPIQVFNTARISSASFDPNPVNDVAIAPLAIEPDTTGFLKIKKVSGPSSTTAGGKAGWIINVHNSGSTATSGQVTLSDPAVPGFTATNVTVTPAINNQGSDPSVTCTLGATPLCTFPAGINAGNSYTITIAGTLSSTVGNGSVLTNTASLSNGETSSATITANNVADVVVLKELTTPAEAGVPLGYQVTVINAGPSAAVNTVITDTLPAGTAIQNLPSGCTNSGQTLTCSLGTLATASVTTLVYQVSIPESGGTFTNLAVATSYTPFLDAITPEASVTVTIPGLAVTGASFSVAPLGIGLIGAGVMLMVFTLRRGRKI
jgi:uncharacterized repeat protein (TIGR01451 family)